MASCSALQTQESTPAYHHSGGYQLERESEMDPITSVFQSLPWQHT